MTAPESDESRLRMTLLAWARVHAQEQAQFERELLDGLKIEASQPR